MKRISISIVIPHFNSRGLIKKALSSVNNLKISKENLEVVIVDDGSLEDEYRNLWVYTQLLHPEIDRKIIRHDKNRGIEYARNTGILACSKDYVMFLDQDDILKADIIENYLLTMDKIRNYNCVIYGKVEVISENGISIGESGPPFPGKFNGDFYIIFDKNKSLMLNFPIPSASGCLIPVTMFAEFGYLDNSLYSGGEIEFLARVVTKYPVVYVNKIVVQKFVHKSNASKNLSKMIDATRLLVDKVALNLSYNVFSSEYNRAVLLHNLKIILLILDDIKLMIKNLQKSWGIIF